MLTAAKLAKFFADRDRELLKFLKQYAPSDDAYEPEPEPPKPAPGPRFKTGSQEWFMSLARTPPKANQGISMNAIARSVPKPTPPRAPGTQERYFNGLWWYR